MVKFFKKRSQEEFQTTEYTVIFMLYIINNIIILKIYNKNNMIKNTILAVSHTCSTLPESQKNKHKKERRTKKENNNHNAVV